MKASSFYPRAYNALKNEIDRLDAFTDQLNREPAQKKERIAEFKCAKYRYAAISNVHSALYNCFRLRAKLYETHYVLLPFHEMLCAREDLMAAYDAVDREERPDAGLYYGMLAFCDMLIAEKEDKLPQANDWEQIELKEYLSGIVFAKACLDEAWKERNPHHE